MRETHTHDNDNSYRFGQRDRVRDENMEEKGLRSLPSPTSAKFSDLLHTNTIGQDTLCRCTTTVNPEE